MHILDTPTELLHLIFTEVSANSRLAGPSQKPLKGLRLLCRAFNNAIIPILFSHISIRGSNEIAHTVAQIEQLAHAHKSGCAYRVTQSLGIHQLGGTYKLHPREQVNALVNAGLSKAIEALPGLRDVWWTIGHADPPVCVEAVVEGLCALPPELDFNVRVTHEANSMHACLARLGARLKSCSIIPHTEKRDNFLVTQPPQDMKLFAAVLAGCPQLKSLGFHWETLMSFMDLDLDAILGALPPYCALPEHLILEGFHVRLGDAAHRLSALHKLTLLTPSRLRGNANDEWLVMLWDALAAARVFPPSLTVCDDSNALIRYLTQHPGLETLNLNTIFQQRPQDYYNDGRGTFEAAFFANILPRHAATLKTLEIELLDREGAVLTEGTIAQCRHLETLALRLAWIDASDFADAFEKLLVLFGALSRLQYVVLTVFGVGIVQRSSGRLSLHTEASESAWDTVAAHVVDNTTWAPAKIVANGRLFCLRRAGDVRRYINVGWVG